jgi:thiamine-phosphate pyrophosphorylase
LKDFSLYVILDKETCSLPDLARAAEQIILGGADIIQLRDKVSDTKTFFSTALAVRKVTAHFKIPLIINDRADLAADIDADGVHLGQDDLPLDIARTLMGKGKIIGCSTHSLEQALKAQADGADYIAVGPIFSTPTKPDYKAVGLDLIKEVKEKIIVPLVAIGGIGGNNMPEVLSRGAKIVAVVRAAVAQKDISAAVKNLKRILSEYKEKDDLIRVGSL